MPTARTLAGAPLAGCTPLFDAAAMREADRAAAEDLALPSVLLMERAGLVSARAVLERFPDRRAALVCVGRGNNGGDGMVVARHLAEAGWAVEVVAPGAEAPATPDGGTMSLVAGRLGIGVGALDPARLAGEERLVVDALLGTGARGAPRGPVGEAVAAIARLGGPVVSLDVPSGVDADTGRVAGHAVHAALTVTYHGDKVGLRVEPGRGRAGEVVVADIGIPSTVRLPAAAWLAGPGAVAAVPRKGAAGDKYRAGAVLVVGGSPGLTGAAAMASRAALRAGAGIVVAAVPRSVQPIVASGLLEVMVAPIDDAFGALGPAAVAPVADQARRVGSVAVGPGMGRAAASTAFVRGLLEALGHPVVVDADGLWHLGERPSWLRSRRGPTILTPHAGEAARLLGRSRQEVEAGRLDAARELAAMTGAVAVLKGPGTVVATPGGEVVVSAVGSEALATAGSGDVLTGLTGALLAKGMTPRDAAVAAVVAHGLAGDLARRGDGTVAGDVIEALPGALSPA